MSGLPVFTIHPSRFAGYPRFEAFAARIGRARSFSDQSSFNSFCRALLEEWRQVFKRSPYPAGELFTAHATRIERQEPSTIPTSWGGVSIIKHEPPHVEKCLVVKRGGYLAFEKHARKEESLTVSEGCGLLLYREHGEKTNEVNLVPLAPNVHYEFRPGQEHCIIGSEDLLVFETSTDPLGMDKDLIFIFTPEAV